MKNFAVLTGTMAGEPHIREGGNNQDACLVSTTDNYIIGVVCDGISAGKHSQVGASLIAHLVKSCLEWHIAFFGSKPDKETIENMLEYIRDIIIYKLKVIIETMSTPHRGVHMEDLSFVSNYMIATSLLFVVTKHYYFVARTGDGVIMIDDTIHYFDSGERNAPDSLSYGAIREPIPGAGSSIILHSYGETEGLTNLLIGSDGVGLFNKKAGNDLPDGSCQGSIMRFFQEDRYVKNPLLVQRQLNKIGHMFNNRAGDDVTFVGVKRCK